jgi:hypothetical protein
MFLGHPDPLFRGMGPDPDSGSFYHQAKMVTLKKKIFADVLKVNDENSRIRIH